MITVEELRKDRTFLNVLDQHVEILLKSAHSKGHKECYLGIHNLEEVNVDNWYDIRDYLITALQNSGFNVGIFQHSMKIICKW